MYPLTKLTKSTFTLCGAPGGSRTHDLWLRKPTLYPTELRAPVADYNKAPIESLNRLCAFSTNLVVYRLGKLDIPITVERLASLQPLYLLPIYAI
jgi:hypothetical protein